MGRTIPSFRIAAEMESEMARFSINFEVFFKSIRLSPEGNSVLYISAFVIILLFIDLLFTTFPFYNYTTQSSSYTLFFFASQILIFGLFQFLYLNLVRRMAPHGKSSESHRSFLPYIDKLIPVTRIILMIILSCIIAEEGKPIFCQ